MASDNEPMSAKIYQFPVRPAARQGRFAAEHGRDPLSAAPAPHIDVEGALYHQAEIDKERARRDH